MCVPNGLNIINMNVLCGGNYAFNPVSNDCSLDTTHATCRGNQWTCNNVGDMGAWPLNANSRQPIARMNALIIIIILIFSLLHLHGSKRRGSGTLPRALQMPGRTNLPSRWLRRSERRWWKLIQLSESRAFRRPIRLSLLFPLRRSVAVATHSMPDRNLLQPIDFGMHSRNLLKRFVKNVDL